MTDFSLQRHVAAPMEAVRRAWTTQEGIATWWWPQLADKSYELDGRVGGRYHFESKAAGLRQGWADVLDRLVLLDG